MADDETRPDKVKGPLTERVVLRAIGELEPEWDPGYEVWRLIAGPDGKPVVFKTQTATAAEKGAAKGEPGKYKSIPLRSWKGGTEIVLPEKPKPESKPFE